MSSFEEWQRLGQRSLSKLVTLLELGAGLAFFPLHREEAGGRWSSSFCYIAGQLEGYPEPFSSSHCYQLPLMRIFSSVNFPLLRRPAGTESLPHPKALNDLMYVKTTFPSPELDQAQRGQDISS